MGNHVSRRRTSDSSPVVRVVLSSGEVRALFHPASVAELMLDHPNECVIELDGRRGGGAKLPPSTPLPADHELHPDKAYMMVPMARRGRKATSAEAARAALDRSSRGRKSPAPSWVSMLRCVGDMERKKKKLVVEEVIVGGGRKNIIKDEKHGREDLLLTGVRAPEFWSRQLSSKGWRPSLDPIEEKGVERETAVRHWLFRAFGLVREGGLLSVIV